ncbi:MAG: hypothetical protein WBX81_01910 [Nitrososphaeraceae archaeon]
MRQQQQLLKQGMTTSQILRIYGKQFRQIQMRYSDGYDGRCAIGVLMSYHGCNGKDEPGSARTLLAALVDIKNEGIDNELLIDLNDSGCTFNEIADSLDGVRVNSQKVSDRIL